jgi:hypothetical protein
VTPPPQTSVGLRWVGNLAELVKDRVLERWAEGRLSAAYPAPEAFIRFGMRYWA